MFELYVRPLLDLTEIFVEGHDGREPPRGLARFAWSLEILEKHVRDAIDGLEVVEREKRIPVRLSVAIVGIQRVVADLVGMIVEDWDAEVARRGSGPWGVFAPWDWHEDLTVDDDSNDLVALVGPKLSRLREWASFVVDPDPFGPPNPHLSADLRFASVPSFVLERLPTSPDDAIDLAVPSPDTIGVQITLGQQVLADLANLRARLPKSV